MFEDLLNQLRNPGENGLPEDFADQLSTAYNEALSMREAQIAEHETSIKAAQEAAAEAQRKLTESQAHAYRLFMQNGVPASGQDDPTGQGAQEGGDGGDEPKPPTLDDLIEFKTLGGE